MVSPKQWPPIGSETLPWRRDPDEIAQIPKSRRRKILSEYEAALPLLISQRDVEIPRDLSLHLEELSAQLARFDAETKGQGFNLPALLLRSESSSSSQIEHLTSSVRNVALAELSPSAPRNARIIAGNVHAMKTALQTSGEVTSSSLVAIQNALMNDKGTGLRTEQVWIGGTPFSPHGAQYVPPSWERVPAYLDDLCAFIERDDISPIAKASIAHAQFETIHPFIDGNGRTERTLLHLLLRNEGLLTGSTLPVSAGLLHDVETYMASLDQYHEGNLLAVISTVADALEVALVLGRQATQDVAEVLQDWRSRITERTGSAIHRLPATLVEQPVVNTSYVATSLDITPRAATNLVARAEEVGILRRIGTARRGVFYQADDLIQILEDIASARNIRRERL